VVALHCNFKGRGDIQPHHRWATGFLVDECTVPDSGIELENRGTMGTGHGWAIGWGVLWNCSAKTLLVQQPPGAMNWAIGCRGEMVTLAMPGYPNIMPPTGEIDSPHKPVSPASLYLAQLSDRLGAQAVRNVEP
jgi:hypothetical protein